MGHTPCPGLEPGRKFLPSLGLLLSYHNIEMQQDKKIAKKRGRPATGTGRTVGVRIRPELSSQIEGWRAQQRPIPSEPEAIRRLVELGLKAKSKG
jgi:hypothetical protein